MHPPLLVVVVATVLVVVVAPVVVATVLDVVVVPVVVVPVVVVPVVADVDVVVPVVPEDEEAGDPVDPPLPLAGVPVVVADEAPAPPPPGRPPVGNPHPCDAPAAAARSRPPSAVATPIGRTR